MKDPDYQITFDCADPDAMARFWAEALRYELEGPPEGHSSWRDYWLRSLCNWHVRPRGQRIRRCLNRATQLLGLDRANCQCGAENHAADHAADSHGLGGRCARIAFFARSVGEPDGNWAKDDWDKQC